MIEPSDTAMVVACSVVACVVIRLVKHAFCAQLGVDLIAFSHGLICALVSWHVIMQLDDSAAYLLLGDGPISEAERVLPMITWGYSLYDIFDGIRMGDRSFIFHGVTLFGLCWGLHHSGKLFLLTLPLVTETSTPFLHLTHGFDLTAFKLAFLVTFLLIRWVYVPYVWCKYVYGASQLEAFRPQDWTVLLGGLPIHGLNLYWGVKVIRKAARALGYLPDNRKKNA